MPEATDSCSSCGAALDSDALFCPACGNARGKGDSDPLVGEVVGERYLILERLGHGGSGTIYRGEHVTLRRKVAVKVLHHELSRDDLAVERFRREATTVGEIDNPHIVEIHDFGRVGDGRLYLAMEFLVGETLDTRLAAGGKLDAETAVDILEQLGEALMEAHAIGYVHRDLRPRNIFLSKRRGRDGYVKLLDFGLAKLVESDAGEAASTSLGMTFGDPKYMSPEQARGDAFDRRADIYSLGCIAYEMLTGAPPFVGGKVFDILTRHVEEEPTPPAELDPEVPAWLSQTVMQMLAKNPDDRFITVYRLVEALEHGGKTGEAMTAALARRMETEPPPSVSQAMARISPGSAPYSSPPPGTEPAADSPPEPARPSPLRAARAEAEEGAAKAEGAAATGDDEARADTEEPSAGDTVMGAAPPPAARPRRSGGAPPPSSQAGQAVPGSTQGERPSQQATVPTAVPSLGERTEPNTEPAAAPEPSSSRAEGKPRTAGTSPTPIPGRVAVPVAAIARADSGASARQRDRSPADDASAGSSASTSAGASGKSSRTAAASSAGISAAWFADGDALETGEDVESKLAIKLQKARGDAPLTDDEDEYFDAPATSGRKMWMALGAVVGLLGLVAAAVLLSGGDDDDGSAEAGAAATEEPGAGEEVAAAGSPAVTPLDDSAEPIAGDQASDSESGEPAASGDRGGEPDETAADSGSSDADGPATAPQAPGARNRKPGGGAGGSAPAAHRERRSKPDRSDKPDRPDKPAGFTLPGELGDRPVDPYDESDSRPEPGRGGGGGDEPADGDGSAGPDKAKADFYVKLGRNDLASGNYLGAATNFNKARQLDGNSAAAIAGLGEIALQQNSFGSAVRHLSNAVRLRKSARTYTLLGEAHLGAGDSEAAAEAFKQALRIKPGDSRALAGYDEATK